MSGSIGLGALPASAGNLRMFSTGSIVQSQDRTGQLVREGEGEVWLVRDTGRYENGHQLVAVNEDGDERRVGEDQFWPFGPWRKVGG